MSKTIITRYTCDATGCNRTLEFEVPTTSSERFTAMKDKSWTENFVGSAHLCPDHSPAPGIEDEKRYAITYEPNAHHLEWLGGGFLMSSFGPGVDRYTLAEAVAELKDRYFHKGWESYSIREIPT